MTIARVASASALSQTTAATMSVTCPTTGVAVGQLAVLWFTTTTIQTGGTTATPPTGWTALSSLHQQNTLLGVDAWYKSIASGDIGATLTVTSTVGTQATKRTLAVTIYSGATIGASASAFESTATLNHTCPAVTAVSANAWVLNSLLDRASPGSTAFTLPSNLHLLEQQFGAGGGAGSMVVADDDLVGAGSVGNNTISGTVSTANAIMSTLVLEPTTGNVPPTCNAGADQTNLEPYTTVTLSATDSDTDGTVSTRAWSQTAGTVVTLTGASSRTLTFTAPGTIGGDTLTFQYQVTDNGGATASDTVNVSVLPVTERAAIGGVEVPMQIREN